jgi:hypothetical protein
MMSKTEWNKIVWASKLGFALFWTIAVAFAWVMWTGGTLNDPEIMANETASGCVMLTTSGCCGGTWMVGIVGLLLITALLRRE